MGSAERLELCGSGVGVGGQFLWIRGFGPVGMVNGENVKGPTALSRSQ